MGIFGTGAAILGGAAKLITGNQTKQRQKGLIGQAYREDAFQQGLTQANTRQSSNEALNARGILTPGANPGPIGTALQQVAKSGGKKIAGSGVDPFLMASSAGAIGAANTLSGAQNQQMTDQFALERLDLARGKSTAERANRDQYYSTIGNAVGGVFKSLGADASVLPQPGASASIPGTPSPIASSGQMAGAYGMPINPTFFGGSPGSQHGTVVGDGAPNYSFNG